MKRSIAIVLTFVLLCLAFQDLLVHWSFKIHQDAIAAELCVNRFEPQTLCFGNCYLNQMLIEKHQEQQSPGVLQLEQQQLINFYIIDQQSFSLYKPLGQLMLPNYSLFLKYGNFTHKKLDPPRQISTSC